MAKRVPCPSCGTPLTYHGVVGAAYCPACQVAWTRPSHNEATNYVIDVAASPIPPDDNAVQVPERFAPHAEPEILVSRYGDGGGGCCLIGCLLVFVFFYLAFRGLMSLF